MSFSVNTNIASLQAQNYLRTNSDFQAKTISRVTSGLRIVMSGDDAAGLAIANGFRSDQAVLTQGIRNATDGLSTLQTIDGGMNNISQLLDRARTLATQSASDTFQSDRGVVNSEFQSVIGEINRQAQSIGLDSNGAFAKALSVFIGGGRGSNAGSVISNGSVQVDLSRSTVDVKSLGLSGFQSAGSGANLENTSATSVSAILTDATNAAAEATANTTQFKFVGSGFTGGITITVNLNGVTDGGTLVKAINGAIQSAAQQGSAAATAFGNSSVSASIVTDSSGHQNLAFTAAGNAFQVQATDLTSNALLGNVAVGGAPTGAAALGVVDAGGSYSSGTLGLQAALAATDKQTLSFVAHDQNGVSHQTAITLDNVTGATVGAALTAINAQLQGTNDSTLQNIVAVAEGPAAAPTGIKFLSTSGFDVTVGKNPTAAKGFGSNLQQGTVIAASVSGTGSSLDVSNQADAKTAVTALYSAVQTLGAAQAVVGKGENQLNYAVNLAQSQNTNLAAAESRIRDADLATEAANLTKAQILIQAGTAALAQANSAPQAILSLLRG